LELSKKGIVFPPCSVTVYISFPYGCGQLLSRDQNEAASSLCFVFLVCVTKLIETSS
jgi:hypothetical protein